MTRVRRGLLAALLRMGELGGPQGSPQAGQEGLEYRPQEAWGWEEQPSGPRTLAPLATVGAAGAPRGGRGHRQGLVLLQLVASSDPWWQPHATEAPRGLPSRGCRRPAAPQWGPPSVCCWPPPQASALRLGWTCRLQECPAAIPGSRHEE